MDIDLINQEMEEACVCALKTTSRQAVFGRGNSQANVIFVGEAPGKNEDEKGEPFVGASGRVLNSLLSSIGMNREEIYVTNIVKYRPPDNRDPSTKEITDCFPWLAKEIAFIKPKVIIPLGRHALAQFIPGQKISDAHGRTFTADVAGVGQCTIYALYHPAAALYNSSLRQTLLEDFSHIPQILKGI